MSVVDGTEIATVSAGVFKAKCLKMMDEAVVTQQRFNITKRGKVVGQFVPAAVETKPFRSIFGRTPSGKAPSMKEWAKLKAEWAQDWDESLERSLAVLAEKPKKRKRA